MTVRQEGESYQLKPRPRHWNPTQIMICHLVKHSGADVYISRLASSTYRMVSKRIPTAESMPFGYYTYIYQ